MAGLVLFVHNTVIAMIPRPSKENVKSDPVTKYKAKEILTMLISDVFLKR
jgi:hypothetical protein